MTPRLWPLFFFLPGQSALDAARMVGNTEAFPDLVGQDCGIHTGCLVLHRAQGLDDLATKLQQGPK